MNQKMESILAEMQKPRKKKIKQIQVGEEVHSRLVDMKGLLGVDSIALVVDFCSQYVLDCEEKNLLGEMGANPKE